MICIVHFSYYPGFGGDSRRGGEDKWWLEVGDVDDPIEQIPFVPADPESDEWEPEIDKALAEAGWKRLTDIKWNEYDSTFQAERVGDKYEGVECDAEGVAYGDDAFESSCGTVSVRPVAVQSIHDGAVALYLFDLISGAPLRWKAGDPGWRVNVERSDDQAGLCTIIRDVIGDDDESFTECADGKLVEYGLRLGRYVEDEALFYGDVDRPDKFAHMMSAYYEMVSSDGPEA